jgi:succinoglycan biosynthesis protein ExoA
MRLLLNPQRLQAACNLALRASGGAELFMRCDAHAYYPPGFIARAVRLLDQHRADGVAYSDRPFAGGAARNAFQCGVGFAQNNWLGVGQSRYRLGTFSGWVDHGKHGCFRRDLLLAAGGYDETFAVNEDSELSYRLVQRGAHLWLDQELWVGYVPRSRPGALARQYFRRSPSCTSPWAPASSRASSSPWFSPPAVGPTPLPGRRQRVRSPPRRPYTTNAPPDPPAPRGPDGFKANVLKPER